jgi:hypothetical protein
VRTWATSTGRATLHRVNFEGEKGEDLKCFRSEHPSIMIDLNIVRTRCYLFSPRKSPPTPIGHLGEGAHKVLIYDFTFFPIILHHHIREFY